MARPLRIQYPGAVYHVTARGNERKSIVRDDQDRRCFLTVLKSSMDNHYHLLLETPESNLIRKF